MLKKIKFQPGSIGINFRGNSIIDVATNSQAGRKGVCVGWTILKINDEIQSNNGEKIIEALIKAGKTKKTMSIEFQDPTQEKIIKKLQLETDNQEDFIRGKIGRSEQEIKKDIDLLNRKKRYVRSVTADELFTKKFKRDEFKSDPEPKRISKRLFLPMIKIGFSFMGAVSVIQPSGLLINLPSRLVGFLPVNEISNEIADQMAKRASSESLLKKLFHVGQFVRVIVIDLTKRKNGKDNLVLSMRPDRFNMGIKFNNLNVNSVVHGSIQSQEDKGYVVNVGISGYSGFLDYSDISGIKGKLIIGQLFNFAVTSKSGRCLKLTLEPKRIRDTVVKYHDDIDFEYLKPGMLVDTSVSKVDDDGIEVVFLKNFKGTIELLHLEFTPEKDWAQHYDILSNRKESYNARILFVDKITKHIGLSLRPNLVNLLEYKFKEKFSMGTIIEKAIIVNIIPNHGMILIHNRNSKDEKNIDPIFLYAHVSQCRKTKGETVDLTTSYKIGESIRCRILSSQRVDGICSVTMTKETIDSVLFAKDLKVGSMISGKVKSIQPYGLLISLSPTVTALCPNIHLTDAVTYETAEKIRSQFTLGKILEYRIFSIDTVRKRILLTHKSILIKSNLPILDSFDSGKKGMIMHCIIRSVQKSYLFVECYNHITGDIRKKQLIDDGAIEANDILAERFAVGQVVTCTILKVESRLKKLIFRLGIFEEEEEEEEEKEKEAKTEKEEDDHRPLIGELVTGSIDTIIENRNYLGIVLHSPWNKIHGILRSVHLSDHSKNAIQLFKTYQHDFGNKSSKILIKKMILLKQYTTNGKKVIEFSMKPSFVYDAKKRNKSKKNKSKILVPRTEDEIKEGTFVHGYVSELHFNYIIVTFYGKLKIKILKRYIARNLVGHPKNYVTYGQSVRIFVLSKNNNKLFGSISSVHVSPEPISDTLLVQSLFAELKRIDKYAVHIGLVKDKTIKSISQIKLGCNINGTVESITKTNIVARLKKNGADEILGSASKPYHTQKNNSQIKFSVGETLKCRLLDFNESHQICCISFRRELIKKPKLRKKRKKELKIQQHVLVTIQFISDQYMVVSLPKYNHCLGYTSVSTYNSKLNYKVGDNYEATILNQTSDSCQRMLVVMGTKLSY